MKIGQCIAFFSVPLGLVFHGEAIEGFAKFLRNQRASKNRSALSFISKHSRLMFRRRDINLEKNYSCLRLTSTQSPNVSIFVKINEMILL